MCFHGGVNKMHKNQTLVVMSVFLALRILVVFKPDKIIPRQKEIFILVICFVCRGVEFLILFGMSHQWP